MLICLLFFGSSCSSVPFFVFSVVKINKCVDAMDDESKCRLDVKGEFHLHV